MISVKTLATMDSMKRNAILFLSFFGLILAAGLFGLSSRSFGKSGKTVVIAVIDTGLNENPALPKMNLCRYGHMDFSGSAPVKGIGKDELGHGTNVSYIIDENLRRQFGRNQYCLVIVKYYNPKDAPTMVVQKSLKAIAYVSNLQVDVLNISSAGNKESYNFAEKIEISKLLNKGVIVSAAAGNNGRFIDSENPVYPAMYDERVHVVGALYSNGKATKYSNWGLPNMYWEVGHQIDGGGIVLNGTSQATAVHTFKLAAIMIKGRF